MNMIERLTQYYHTKPPRLSFGGSKRSSMHMSIFDKWPEQEATKSLGIIVWRHSTMASPDIVPGIGYCMVDVCLDVFGRSNPDILPLPLEMQHHQVKIVVYVDHLDCIRMRAIGSYACREFNS